jgi:hypothetical protein
MKAFKAVLYQGCIKAQVLLLRVLLDLHTSAYVSIRQHTYADCIKAQVLLLRVLLDLALPFLHVC